MPRAVINLMRDSLERKRLSKNNSNHRPLMNRSLKNNQYKWLKLKTLRQKVHHLIKISLL